MLFGTSLTFFYWSTVYSCTLVIHLHLITNLALSLLQFYLSSAGCKYGKSCKFNHGRGKAAVTPVAEYNFLGLPIRPVLFHCLFFNLFALLIAFKIHFVILLCACMCIIFGYLCCRARESVLTTCVMVPASMGQIVGLIILILQQ